MKNATCYEDWQNAALALDHLQNNDVWKTIDGSSDYDFELIQSRLSQLRIARKENDINALTFLLRTSNSAILCSSGLNINCYYRYIKNHR